VKFRSALLEAEQVFEERDFRLAANFSNLALTRQEQGDFKEAEKLYRRVLELREKYLPAESVEIASALNNVAAVLHAEARDQEADQLLRRAVLMAENAHDDRVLAASLNTLGLVLAGEGEPARAEPVLRRALAVFEKIGGADSVDAGKTLNNLAAIYSNDHELLKSEDCARRALAIYEKGLPPGHPLIGAALNNLFVILGMQKRYDEGEPYLRRALEIAERAAPDSLRTQQILGNLAALEEARGNWQTAADLLEKLIGVEERLLGPNHPSLAITLGNYSEALKHLNHKTEAKQVERRASAIMKSFRQD
jgi:tetratricopeptide (TPR) repeat protein